ncbi:MAG: trypsin-like peptidase domain-containing protein [Gemmataceae bacterium]
MIKFACPGCQKVLQAPADKAGAKVTCPGCKGPITIPQGDSSQAVTTAPALPAPPPMASSPPAVPTDPGWLYTTGGKRQGPVSWQQLQQLAASGQLQPEDQVWTKGMSRACPAQQVQGLFVAGNAAAAPPAEPAAPRWKRALVESQEIARATGVQTIRPLRYGRNVVQGRGIRRQAGESQLALGQKMYDAQQGDAGLREQIRALGERAHDVTARKAETQKLVTERKQLLQELAEPALADEVPPAGAELEHAAAREARGRLDVHREQMQADRLVLFPTDALAWRRVGIGYGICALVALFAIITLWPEAKQVQVVKEEPKRVLKPMNTEEIYAASARSVCFIKSEKAFGTGFMVRPGVVATNAHVLGLYPVKHFSITFPSSGSTSHTIYEPTLLYYDSRRDLAFLKIDSKIEPLWIAESYEFRPGRDVSTIGNPGLGPKDNLNNAVSKGVMSTEKTLKDLKFYQLDLSVNPGNSGGPVFDNMGQVVGVVTLKASQEERISFCIPLTDLRAALDKLDKQSTDDAARAAARYHFDMSFIRTAAIGEMYSASLSRVMAEVFFAIRNKEDPGEILTDARSLWTKIRQAETRILRDVKLDVIASDKNLPADLRRQFAELRSNIDEMKKQTQNLRGDLRALNTRIQDLRTKHRDLVESIRVTIGMDKDDIFNLDDEVDE